MIPLTFEFTLGFILGGGHNIDGEKYMFVKGYTPALNCNHLRDLVRAIVR